MGKQHRKVIKRRRRKDYLKRKKELEKTNQVLSKKADKPAPKKAAKKAAKKVAKKAAKKVAKKVAAEAPKEAEEAKVEKTAAPEEEKGE